MTHAYSAAEQMELDEGRVFSYGDLVHCPDEGHNGTVVGITKSHNVGTAWEWTSEFWYYDVRFLNGAESCGRAMCFQRGWRLTATKELS